LKIYIYIYFVAFGLLLSCKKEKPAPEPVPTPIPPATQNPLPACQNIPPAPQPFGWKDSSITDDENVNFFRAQPYKAGDYIYCVNGEVFPENRLYLYTFSTQQRIPLGERDEYLPDLSSNGWMVYSTSDKNIYKIKLNGDSLTQITFNGACSNPKWDPSGKYIYCYQQTTSLTASSLFKLNKNGQALASYLTQYPSYAASKSPDKAYVLTVQNNRLVVLLRHLVNNSETLITTSGFVLSSAQNDFFNLSIDPKEEYLYWSNTKGILRCNLASKQVDTLFKNCPSITYLNPVVSQNSEELTFCCKVLRPLNSLVLHREYRCFEFNLTNKQWRELDFFPN
jgi:hypothetical protein